MQTSQSLTLGELLEVHRNSPQSYARIGMTIHGFQPYEMAQLADDAGYDTFEWGVQASDFRTTLVLTIRLDVDGSDVDVTCFSVDLTPEEA